MKRTKIQKGPSTKKNKNKHYQNLKIVKKLL